jgi:hypothetical protein
MKLNKYDKTKNKQKTWKKKKMKEKNNYLAAGQKALVEHSR